MTNPNKIAQAGFNSAGMKKGRSGGARRVWRASKRSARAHLDRLDGLHLARVVAGRYGEVI